MAQNKLAHIAVTTRNRPELLRALVRDIQNEARGELRVKIHVYDDATPKRKRVDGAVSDCYYTRFSDHHGRDNYWAIVDRVFKDAKSRRWDYFFMFPDDVELVDGFFYGATALFDRGGADMDCLSFNSDHRTAAPNWGSESPEYRGLVVLTDWMDLCFLCDRRALGSLNYEVLPVTERMAESSGVGAQLSRRLREKGVSMYHSSVPLVHHGSHDSEMHPEHRKHNPLIH